MRNYGKRKGTQKRKFETKIEEENTLLQSFFLERKKIATRPKNEK